MTIPRHSLVDDDAAVRDLLQQVQEGHGFVPRQDADVQPPTTFVG